MRERLIRLATAGLVLGSICAGGFYGWGWWTTARDRESTDADAAVLAARADVDLTQRNLARETKLVAKGWTPEGSHDVATADSHRESATLARVEAAAAAARGYNPAEAAPAAIAVIQKSIEAQVAVLSFSEAFLSPALLFVVAVPILISIKIAQTISSRHGGH